MLSRIIRDGRCAWSNKVSVIGIQVTHFLFLFPGEIRSCFTDLLAFAVFVGDEKVIGDA